MFIDLYGVDISEIPPLKKSKLRDYGGIVIDTKMKNLLYEVIDSALL